ncbi:MFS transporter [Nocardia sp. AG03]|uniref:MFS transporter n=1 Tax=Nocardia sp. AG03 TaxID=3025312 RepID=UPI0024183492|nr:MFS transporter [Nocardia sp. AG03]
MSQTVAPTAHLTTEQRRSVAVLVVLLAGQFMAVLDASIVNVAVPAMRADLRSDGAGLQLIVAGYVIAYAVLLVGGARLGERYTQRRAFVAGLAVFTVASLACGLAWNELSLIVFRFVQGVGAAGMVPQVMTMIQRTFTGSTRARALGLYAAIVSSGVVVGQILGGVIVDADLAGSGWRGVFLVNVPLGLALWVMAVRVLPVSERVGRRIDVVGLVTLTVAVSLLVVPLMVGYELGFPRWTVVCLGAGVVSVVVFGVVERAVALRGGEPLFAPSVVRATGLVSSAATLSLIMAIFSGWLFACALYLQGALGFGAVRAGVQFLPMGVAFAVAGLSWQRVPTRWHARMIPCALMLDAVALAWLAVVWDAGTGVAVAIAFGLFGVGNGLAFGPLMTRALAAVPVPLAADASGILVTAVQVGIVAGIASLGSVFLATAETATAAEAVRLVHLGGAAMSLVAAGTAALAVRGTRR